MSRRVQADGARLEVDDPGEPQLRQDAPAVQQPPAEDELGQEVALEAQVGWDVEGVEDCLMGLWNLQVLYYGMDYAAEPGELRPAAQRLVPVFDAYVPTEMRGVIGTTAGVGVVAGTGVAMWQREKRVRARQHPRGPLAALLRRRQGAVQASQPAAAAASAAPAPSGPPAAVQATEGPPEAPARGFRFTAAEEAAIRASRGVADQPLESYGLPGAA